MSQNVSRDLQKLVLSIGFQAYSADQLLKLVKRSKGVMKDGVLNISEHESGGLAAVTLSPQVQRTSFIFTSVPSTFYC